MIRIALLGCDSTHTEAFASRLNGSNGLFRDRAQVVSLYGQDNVQAASKAAALGITKVCLSIEEALDGADLAMVIGRFGESHFGPAQLAILRGIPTFVDKPFTVSFSEAQELAALAHNTGVPLTSSSPLRFSREVMAFKNMIAARPASELASVVVTVPASCTDLGPDPRLNSAFFYGIHGIEMLLELVGHEIEDVKIAHGRTAIAAHLDLKSGITAVLQLIRGTAEFYSIDVHWTDASHHSVIQLDGSYYDGVISYLIDGFLGKQNVIPIESNLFAVSILERIDQLNSIKTQL